MNQKGYITLLSTLFLVAIGGVVASSLILLGLGFSKTSFALDQSNQAKALANACAEEALQKIRDSTSFSGTNTILLGQGSCTYTVTSSGVQTRVVTAQSLVGSMVRKVKIRMTINPQNLKFNIASWQEVADF